MIIYFLLLLALILRLFFVNQSLWLDEAIGAIAVRDLSYQKIISEFLIVDNHPPLYYLLLKIWTQVLGYSEFMLRLPSVLFGLGTIYLTYKIAGKIFPGKRIPLITALLLATSQFHVYYSQEARMYSMAAFFSTFTVFAFLNLINGSKGTKYWIIFSVSSILLLFTDYMPIFLFPALFLFAVYKKLSRGWWYKFILTFIPLLIAGLLWLPVFIEQSAGGSWLIKYLPAWKEVAGGANLKQFILLLIKFSLGRISFTDKLFYYTLLLIVSVPFGYLFYNALRSIKKYPFIFFWLAVPLVSSFLASIFFPAFIYFRLLYLLPAFYLYMVSGFNDSEKTLHTVKISTVVLSGIIFINIFSLLTYYFDNYQKREEWKEAVSFVEERIEKNEIILFSYPEPFAPYRWYERYPDLSYGATDSIKATPQTSSEITRDLIKGKSGIYYFEYLKDISDPEESVINTIISSRYRKESTIGDFQGVGFIHYFKK